MSMDKWATSVIAHSLGQTAPSAWKFEPSPRPHTHSDPIISKHTELVRKLCMDLSSHILNFMIHVKTLCLTEKQGSGLLCPSKKFQTHPLEEPTEAEPSFRKVSLSHVCFFPLTSRLESFGHKCTPFDRPWIEAYRLAWKMAEPRILKGKPSKLHWSGMPFTFQPALWVLQHAHKHSYSLQV